MAIISADININRKLENQRERGETFENFIFPTHAVSSLSEMLKIILPTPNIIVVVIHSRGNYAVTERKVILVCGVVRGSVKNKERKMCKCSSVTLHDAL